MVFTPVKSLMFELQERNFTVGLLSPRVMPCEFVRAKERETGTPQTDTLDYRGYFFQKVQGTLAKVSNRF